MRQFSPSYNETTSNKFEELDDVLEVEDPDDGKRVDNRLKRFQRDQTDESRDNIEKMIMWMRINNNKNMSGIINLP